MSAAQIISLVAICDGGKREGGRVGGWEGGGGGGEGERWDLICCIWLRNSGCGRSAEPRCTES